MRVIKTVVWVLLAVALLVFSLNNWHTATIRIWDTLVLETPLPVLVVLSFLLGLVPMWLLHKAGRWRLTRRINALENTVRSAVSAPPLATSTQLEAQTSTEQAPAPAPTQG